MATFTRKAIMQTFLHILKNKPLDRITVKDICEQCEIHFTIISRTYMMCLRPYLRTRSGL